LPWVLSLRLAGKHLLLTVHEYELAHPLRKLYIRLLALLADRLFTPSPTLCSRFGAKAHAIPSGSNIPLVPIGSEERERMKAALGLAGRSVLGFFGFRESKGFARFIDAARSLPGDWTALVIGGRSGADSVGDGIVTTGYVASPVKTSHLLQLVDVFYLPYPDGLSERRGSFWAAVEHQVPVISVTGSDTTDRCRGPGIYLYDPSDSPDRWRQLLEQARNGPRPTLPDRLQRDAVREIYRAAYARG
jgi:glycosyltransferase involved in cell wall biosynthesis